MTGWRVYPAVTAAVALAGSGTGSGDNRGPGPPAEPRVLELGWIERSRESGLTFRVEQLVIRQDGWQLTASVANRASAAYLIQRSHRAGESMFGLVLLETPTRKEIRELTADFRKAPPFLEPTRIEPPLPRVLEARSGWRGTLSGSATLRQGSFVRVLFGRFARVRGTPRYLLWVANHAVRLSAGEGIHSARTPTEGAVMSERTSLTDEEIRTDVAQEIREETADADMDDTDADTDDTDSDSDDTDA